MLTNEELQSRANRLIAQYPDVKEFFQALREELVFVSGSIKSIACGGVDFLSADSLDTQEKMILTDVFPFLEKHAFPNRGTAEMAEAIHAFKVAAIAHKTMYGQVAK